MFCELLKECIVIASCLTALHCLTDRTLSRHRHTHNTCTHNAPHTTHHTHHAALHYASTCTDEESLVLHCLPLSTTSPCPVPSLPTGGHLPRSCQVPPNWASLMPHRHFMEQGGRKTPCRRDCPTSPFGGLPASVFRHVSRR